MKTNQFIKEIKSMGFDVKELHYNLAIYEDNDYTLAHVSKKEAGVLATDFPNFYGLEHDRKLQLLDLLNEYAKTPIEDREEEEKYYYKLKGFMEKYLNVFEHAEGVQYILDGAKEAELLGNSFKTQFTDAEFEALPKDIQSHNWEKIKVESEE